nr:MAG TPA: hypothetical protein [Caudoviricetes sp.]
MCCGCGAWSGAVCVVVASPLIASFFLAPLGHCVWSRGVLRLGVRVVRTCVR